MEISQALAEKLDDIIQQWIKAVRKDDAIQIAQELTYQGIRDSVPYVLRALVTLLSDTEETDVPLLINKSLEHGLLRAKQGYDAEEVAREYRLLRQTIFDEIEADLLQSSPKHILHAVRLIDATLDEVIGRCFQTYTESRLSELDQIRSQLILTNKELERLIKTQQENISRLAHELKSPLTSIIGYSDLFLRQQRKSLSQSESSKNLKSIEQVLRSGRHLLRLINDALEISRYESGKMRLNPEPVEICSLMAGIVEVFQPLADEKAIALMFTCTMPDQQVFTDPLRLQQVVTNVISNAIRYTDAGSVTVTCRMVSNDRFAVLISDTGIGISHKDQAQIFEPYYQVDHSHRRPDSTGLGLAIAAQLVELLQGTIHLDSQVGVGTTFTVTLPLRVNPLILEAASNPTPTKM